MSWQKWQEATPASSDEEQFQIGFEGADLTQDALIQVTSEWRGPANGPLPTGLDGYTGRLAKIIGANELSPERFAGNDVGYFPIQPGIHQQVLKFKGDVIATEHLYVHVSGNHQYDNKDFAADATASGILKYRPKHYVPVQAAIPDVPAMRAIQTAENNTGAEIDKEGLYHWRFRPEMQFTVLDLKNLELIQGDAGDDSRQDLLNGDPVTLDPAESAEILYQILTGNFDPLPLIGPLRELLLSLGQGDYPLCVPHSGSEDTDCTVEPLELTPAEIAAILASGNGALALALYLNTDIANVLWDYNEPGLKVLFEYPGSAFAVKPEPPANEGAPALYRVLGGYRLKYQLNLPSGAQNPTYTWTFTNAAGRFCDRYGIGSVAEPGEGCEVAASKEAQGSTNFIYWEPENWTTDLNATGTVIAEYRVPGKPDPVTLEKTFKLQSRPLKPVNAPDDPMEGEDVKMLETVLWQLGLSPQKGIPGYSGARIDSDRGGSLGWTHTCADAKKEADERDIYYTGWTGCAKGLVSMEGMVRRFQARNSVNTSHGNGNAINSGATPIAGVTGTVDQNTLNWLLRDWRAYHKAYDDHRPAGVINQDSPSMDTWLETALAVWDDGLGDNVPPTYTQARHEAMLVSVGLAADWKDRTELLRNWKLQESGSHWGKGSPRTDYRMTEGSGDELGSLSFNQVLYRFRYGATPCTVHAESGLNFYDPQENMQGFMVHLGARPRTASGEVNCEGGFYATYTAAGDPRIPYNRDDLVGYRQNGIFHAIGEREDDYELLSRAIGSYNGGKFWKGNSWPVLLARTTFTTIAARSNRVPTTGTGTCSSCTYTMDVKNVGYGLPYRTYVWVGARYPATQPDGTPHPQAGQPEWCFAYGEQEWRAGRRFNEVKLESVGDPLAGITPIGRINCASGAPMP